MKLIGIDLAWKTEKNTTAAASGSLINGHLQVHELSADLLGLNTILAWIDKHPDTCGIAIDASLIIKNTSGQRPCERELSQVYGARHAACHASNLSLYPDAASVQLAQQLQQRGYQHLQRSGRWQIECYPHPALIEIFKLPQRLKYKKGRVHERRRGQIILAQLLESLCDNPYLSLQLDDSVADWLSPSVIESIRGQALKQHEDGLDALVCLYIAALYANGLEQRVFGDTQSGYVYVPSPRISSINSSPPAF